jgi:hypothetical protein
MATGSLTWLAGGWLALAAGTAQAAEPDDPDTETSEEVLDAGDEWDAFADFEETAAESESPGGTGPLGLSLELHGFAEAAASTRVVKDDASADDFLLGEARGRLEVGATKGPAKARLKIDFIGDAVAEEAALDFREIWVDYSPSVHFSLRAGRQVLTWGTGDFVFLNDLFPKDFQAFFLGRDDEFLKAPSNSVKASLFVEGLGVDLVWTPIFAPDRFISGERLSFFFPLQQTTLGPASASTPLQPILPQKDLENGEFALRLYGNLSGWELAAYGYVGFFKQPLAIDPDSQSLTHSRLVAPGLSVRGLVLGGVFNLEGSYYHSVDDSEGTDPFVPNSQVRGLVGYELELVPKLTTSAQYYVEWTLQHDDLIANSPFPDVEPVRLRHVITARITYLLLSDNLRLSLFAFASPADVDAHLRPAVSYKLTDAVEATVGGTVMFGRDEFTFFGQLEANTSVYARLRTSF